MIMRQVRPPSGQLIREIAPETDDDRRRLGEEGSARMSTERYRNGETEGRPAAATGRCGRPVAAPGAYYLFLPFCASFSKPGAPVGGAVRWLPTCSSPWVVAPDKDPGSPLALSWPPLVLAFG